MLPTSRSIMISDYICDELLDVFQSLEDVPHYDMLKFREQKVAVLFDYFNKNWGS